LRSDRGRRLPLHAGGRRGRAVLTRGPRLGELVEAISGLGLLVVSFLPWYSAGGEDATAWQAFSVIDLVMAAAAIAALSVAIVVLARLSVSYPVAGSAVTVGFGGLALLLIAYRLINPPGSGEVDREIGSWLGLIAAAGITLGGYLGLQEPRASGHQVAPL
jgi:hypothetical protein